MTVQSVVFRFSFLVLAVTAVAPVSAAWAQMAGEASYPPAYEAAPPSRLSYPDPESILPARTGTPVRSFPVVPDASASYMPVPEPVMPVMAPDPVIQPVMPAAVVSMPVYAEPVYQPVVQGGASGSACYPAPVDERESRGLSLSQGDLLSDRLRQWAKVNGYLLQWEADEYIASAPLILNKGLEETLVDFRDAVQQSGVNLSVTIYNNCIVRILEAK
jgi:hypothetical protein